MVFLIGQLIKHIFMKRFGQVLIHAFQNGKFFYSIILFFEKLLLPQIEFFGKSTFSASWLLQKSNFIEIEFFETSIFRRIDFFEIKIFGKLWGYLYINNLADNLKKESRSFVVSCCPTLFVNSHQILITLHFTKYG